MSKSEKGKAMRFEAIKNAQKAVAKHAYIPPSARKKLEAQKKKNSAKGKSD